LSLSTPPLLQFNSIGCHHAYSLQPRVRLPIQNLRYGTGFLFFSDSWSLKMGPIRCPEASVNNFNMMSRNIPEGHRFYLYFLRHSLSERPQVLRSKQLCSSSIHFCLVWCFMISYFHNFNMLVYSQLQWRFSVECGEYIFMERTSKTLSQYNGIKFISQKAWHVLSRYLLTW
jgi:hypothetical protein